ncbi:PREDICTED: THUMP domain-containing protein 3-like [Polistes canadensis]|uniref:THUMP domain-containing protein 3-like n=1 Tax=Polistes canadensis TaxID=91411 RepID=UPI000718CDE9|nr:PREDICTED: THUMP domain-containing protein 3-like [Polistes canadensis]
MMDCDEDSSLYDLFQVSLTNDNLFMIGTSVDTGFEWQAVDECKEKLDKNLHVVKQRGKIYFNVNWDKLIKVQEMRSIDNIFIVGSVLRLKFNGTNKENDLKLCKDATRNDLKLEKALNVWKNVTQFPGKMYPTINEYEEATRNEKNVECVKSNNSKIRKRGQNPANAYNEVLRYRVTCERTGKHSFESPDAAKIIGGELQDKYHWLVDLSLYHLEIICKIVQNEIVTQLRITHESKHHRNIIHFGPTTLRATICYNLLRLAQPNPGDIIIDPMCGSASIPIEGGLVYESSYILCGDNHSKAVLRSKSNIENSCSKSKVDLTQWDVCYLPLLNNSIDIVVTDMPFGKRSGNMMDNRVLYKEFLLQLGRVVRRNTGRLVLLTYDKRSFNLSLQAASDLFKVTKMLGVNIGGLAAVVYVLKRTCIEYK